MKFLRSVEGIVNFTISNLSADFTELTIFWKQNVWTHLQKMEWVDLDALPSLWLHQWNAPVEKRVDLRNGVGLNVTLSKIPSQWSSLEYNTLLHLSPLYSCEARTYLLKKNAFRAWLTTLPVIIYTSFLAYSLNKFIYFSMILSFR